MLKKILINGLYIFVLCFCWPWAWGAYKEVKKQDEKIRKLFDKY